MWNYGLITLHFLEREVKRKVDKGREGGKGKKEKKLVDK